MEPFIVLLYVLMYIVALKKIEYSVFFYLLFGNIISLVDYRIFGYFTLKIIFSFILFFHIFKKNHIKEIFKKSIIFNPLSQFIVIFLSIKFVTALATNLQFNTLRSDDIARYVLNRAVELIFDLVILISITNIYLKENKYKDIFFGSLIGSSVLISLSLFFAPSLVKLGINIRGVQLITGESFSEIGRLAGIFSGGDINSVGAYLNLSLLILLVARKMNYYKTTKVIFIFLLFLLASAIIFTASRMALGTMVLIIIYCQFFIASKSMISFKNILFIGMMIIFGLLMYLLMSKVPRFGLVLNRVTNQGMLSEISEEGARYIRWVKFIEFSSIDTFRFLFGSRDVFYVWGGRFYDPHNYYVAMLYYDGFILLFLYIIKFVQFVKVSIKNKIYAPIIIMLVFKIISTMIISSSAFMTNFILFSIILIYQKREKNVQK